VTMKIKILIDTPAPKREEVRPSLSERVDEALELIDSGHESRREWTFIRNLNNKLCKRDKLSTKLQRILEKIQPIIYKYGNTDTDHKIESKPELHPTSTRSDMKKKD